MPDAMDEAMEALKSPRVEVTDPDGNVFAYQFVTELEHAGKTYVILSNIEALKEGDEQMIAIRVEKTVDGEAEFVLPDDPQEVEDVFDRYMLLSMYPQREETPRLH